MIQQLCCRWKCFGSDVRLPVFWSGRACSFVTSVGPLTEGFKARTQPTNFADVAYDLVSIWSARWSIPEREKYSERLFELQAAPVASHAPLNRSACWPCLCPRGPFGGPHGWQSCRGGFDCHCSPSAIFCPDLQELIFGPENVTAGCTSDLRQARIWVHEQACLKPERVSDPRMQAGCGDDNLRESLEAACSACRSRDFLWTYRLRLALLLRHRRIHSALELKT